MLRWTRLTLVVLSLCGLAGCEEALQLQSDPDELGPNPFLEEVEDGKGDTGYLNLRGVEVHVTLEADIQASSWRIFDAPPDLAQFAVTYLKKHDHLYIEILAEDATAPGRVEWLVDGEWLTRAQVSSIPTEQLTHFRMRGVNAVFLEDTASLVNAGQVFPARVPINPYTLMTDAGDKCADPDSHITLDNSVYWYLWNPDRSGCELRTQDMTVTVDEVLPANPESYPEYDQLWEDNRLDVVVLFGKLDDGDVADDYNWDNVTALGRWLTDANFTEVAEAPLGRRFTRTVGDLTEVVDIYGPDLFHSVADSYRMPNWQRAVSEHEVVLYNGHSVLGTGYAFEHVTYPEHYQIFQIASCLSYEYYVRPILAGKGGWEKVDVISNVEPTYYHENLPLVSTLLARLLWGFENQGQASWQDIMEAVSRRLYHSRFGVSGARDNCYTPQGNRCIDEPGDDGESIRYQNTSPNEIPDNDPEGITSTITVEDSATISSLKVDIDLTHTWIGDLQVTLTHQDRVYTLWERSGGSADNIQATLPVDAFNGMDAAGDWILRVTDLAARDTGTLQNWAIVVTP
ncbi:MAG: proprotein convertase P-domain-containing protein [Bradymonadales bacterium]|nr:proprotein convertase P-domain-containing protein [Bradymonadales bacterium]